MLSLNLTIDPMLPVLMLVGAGMEATVHPQVGAAVQSRAPRSQIKLAGCVLPVATDLGGETGRRAQSEGSCCTQAETLAVVSSATLAFYVSGRK